MNIGGLIIGILALWLCVGVIGAIFAILDGLFRWLERKLAGWGL